MSTWINIGEVSTEFLIGREQRTWLGEHGVSRWLGEHGVSTSGGSIWTSGENGETRKAPSTSRFVKDNQKGNTEKKKGRMTS